MMIAILKTFLFFSWGTQNQSSPCILPKNSEAISSLFGMTNSNKAAQNYINYFERNTIYMLTHV